ncbi:2'-5' RNA ligase family protein [Actinomadura gamaensis]|uniref:2'-5' RNA ligase family protein n=1 Tax=Actinomadura gamaensis TaxID=1763541 RepID=A0ABV9TXM6_9ACTN
MSPLPSRMVDRWRVRGDQLPGEEVLYWHILLRDHPAVVALAERAQERLVPFADGLHFTPLEWLHITTLVVGRPPDDEAQLKMTADVARDLLERADPARVDVGRVLYHPEAIVLAVEPRDALARFRSAAQAATRAVDVHGDVAPWFPHVTVAYSTADQPAAPIISALGRRLPSASLTLDTLQLVSQVGPERSWNWRVLGEIPTGGSSGG